MKALLLTVTPELLVRILNGEASILVRKLFPKDYVGWVYLYCSKGKKLLFDKEQEIYFVGTHNANLEKHSADTDVYMNTAYELGCNNLNGKVVARFWCDKVEEIYFEREVIGEICDMPMLPRTDTLSTQELIEKSCTKYLPYGETEIGNYLDDKGYAIRISQLEIFDEPRELDEFGKPITYYENISSCPDQYDLYVGRDALLKVKKAPTNYMWVEEIED